MDECEELELMRSANAIVDLMAHIGLAPQIKTADRELKLSTRRTSELTQQTKAHLMSIFSTNMKTLYEKSSWGWNEKELFEETFHPLARFLLVEHDEVIVAFAMFRFDWDDETEPEYPVLYLYQLQIQDSYQRLGLGRELIQQLQEIKKCTKMKKIMLTCFKCNQSAMNFYKSSQFHVDVNSPSSIGIDVDYEILSIS